MPRSILKMSPSSEPQHKSVTFSEQVTVNEHAMILGDHPCCGVGAPVTIEWKAQETSERHMGLHEYFVQSRQANFPGRTRAQKIPAEERTRILIECSGCSIQELIEATMLVDDIKTQRRETLVELKKNPVAKLLFKNSFTKAAVEFGSGLDRFLRALPEMAEGGVKEVGGAVVHPFRKLGGSIRKRNTLQARSA